MSGNSNNSSGSQGPPQGNNVLQYYQEWADKTPFVTRTSLIALCTVFVLSFFFPLDTWFGNMPFFTFFKLEIYRLFISFLVGNSFLMLIFTFMFYPQMGSRMESAYGSAYYLYMILMFAFLTNVTFMVICVLGSFVGSEGLMFLNCSGFWIVLFSFITIECLMSPGQPRRLMCIPYDIPSTYYPWALFALFCLFSGFQIPFAVAILLGHAFHKGHLDKLKPSSQYLDQLESQNGMLHSLSRSKGWILASSSLGQDMWIPVNQVDRDEEAARQPPAASSGASTSRFAGLNTLSSTTTSTKPEEKKEMFPGAGHTLGTSSANNNLSRETLASKRLAALGVSTV